MPAKRASTSQGGSTLYRDSRLTNYRSDQETAEHEAAKPELADETPLTHVYFALDTEAAQIKIGITKNVDNRLKQLETQRKRPLDLLGTMRGGYNLERAMHQRFRQHRVEANEWYSTEIIAQVADLLQAA